MTNRLRYSYLLISLTLAIPLCAHAVSERITRYSYDASGNIVRIQTIDHTAAPLVDSVSQSFINVGRSVVITLTGENLTGAQVLLNTPELTADVLFSDENRLVLRLTAADEAPLGESGITVRNGVGETEINLTVAERLPGLTTLPNPPAVTTGGFTTLSLRFSPPRPTTERYVVEISDPQTATTATSVLVLSAGQEQAMLVLNGVAEGVTELRLSLAERFFFFSLPVIVAEPFQAVGGESFYSTSVGVRVRPPEDPNQAFIANAIISAAVGVSVAGNNVDGAQNDGIFSNAVGVSVGNEAGSATNLISQSVGVSLSNAVSSNSVLYSPAVGVMLKAQATESARLIFEKSFTRLAPIPSAAIEPDNGPTVQLKQTESLKNRLGDRR